MKPVIAITTGEPAGIGPEISLRAAWASRDRCYPVLIGDLSLLSAIAADIDDAIHLLPMAQGTLPDDALPEGTLRVIDIALAVSARPGQLDSRNAFAMITMLDVAIDGALKGLFDAIVTAPLQKSIISDAGIAFTGHTEYLAERTHTDQVVMMLAGSVHGVKLTYPLRVALATTHLPLRAVPDAIRFDSLQKTLAILDNELKRRFGLPAPHICVCGLNPHAGEDGYLGREEIEVIAPAIAAAKAQGINASGPYPADTVFVPSFLQKADCILAMYHDQGLPVLKHASFERGINVTLGLPIIRTSVDHGTALDQARKGIGHANDASMKEAILLAIDMAAHR